MAICVRARAARRIELIERPRSEPGPGCARIRVRRCGICGSDLHFFVGRQAPPSVCPGHEFSGEIAALGADTQGWREGDRVCVEPLTRCGSCRRCRAGDYHMCADVGIYGIHHDGAMASEVHVATRGLFALPAQVDFALGALTEPLAVGVHALRLAGVGKGSRVLVLGAGTIGLLSAVAARHLEADHVAISARHPQQHEAAVRLGVDQVIDPDSVRSCSPQPDVVIETVGGEATTVADAVAAVDYAGSVIVVGLFEGRLEFDPLLMMIKEVRMISSMVYNTSDGQADFQIALDILSQRGQDLRSLITHEFPLEQAQKAFETAADKSSGALKVMLEPR